MSLLQYPDTINLSDLQIWNNAAFDNRGGVLETLGFDSTKENQSHNLCKSPVLAKTPLPIKPLHPNGAIENSGKPLKMLLKQDLLLPSPIISNVRNEESVRDESKIDKEIEEIQMEINRLGTKLESLRLEKAEIRIKSIGIVEKKQNLKNSIIPPSKKIEVGTPAGTPLVSSATSKFRQRAMSLGPSEISFGIRSQQKGKQEKTPIQSTTTAAAQNRRKSCFWKLQEIDEEKVTKQRVVGGGGVVGRCSSVSPKSHQSVSKIQVPKQGFTSIGSKKFEKKSIGFLSSIQPKNLFREDEKSVSAKKPVTKGRVIASRYSLIPHSTGIQTQTELRKRSLSGIECSKKPISLARKSNESESNQVTKMPLEIGNEAMEHKKTEDNIPPLSMSKIEDLLPRIRTIRCRNDSPRDSGRAKKVAELVGKKSYFATDEKDTENSVIQSLSFDATEEE